MAVVHVGGGDETIAEFSEVRSLPRGSVRGDTSVASLVLYII
jgi:hypothetical protein